MILGDHWAFLNATSVDIVTAVSPLYHVNNDCKS